jgi:hypothetical protein
MRTVHVRAAALEPVAIRRTRSNPPPAVCTLIRFSSNDLRLIGRRRPLRQDTLTAAVERRLTLAELLRETPCRSV